MASVFPCGFPPLPTPKRTLVWPWCALPPDLRALLGAFTAGGLDGLSSPLDTRAAGRLCFCLACTWKASHRPDVTACCASPCDYEESGVCTCLLWKWACLCTWLVVSVSEWGERWPNDWVFWVSVSLCGMCAHTSVDEWLSIQQMIIASFVRQAGSVISTLCTYLHFVCPLCVSLGMCSWQARMLPALTRLLV